MIFCTKVSNLDNFATYSCAFFKLSFPTNQTQRSLKIQWGFIGCGDVTEKKIGPAFNKVAGSKVTAVMSRNAEKAKSYAQRHHVPKWYTDPQELVDDPDVNAIK